MQSNNEHTSLRRRMAKRLGRSIPAAAWAKAIDDLFVAEALDPAYRAAEDGLANHLAGILRTADDIVRDALRRSRAVPSAGLDSAYLSARIEAVSRLAAGHAAGDEEILRFRERVLGRGTPMSAEEAEAYLDLPEAIQPRRTGGSRSGPIELLQYQNRHVFHDIHIWTGSPLDDLRKLAASLAQSYPWEPAQAAAFVLEGLIPLATPFTLHFPQTWHSTRPRRAKVVMEVELWMPAAAVLRAYRDLQRKVLPGYNRQLSRRSIALVTFVLRNRPATWQMLLDRWNNEHPNWRFPDYRRLRTAFKRAEKSLLQPRYEPYLGPRD